MWYDSNTDEIPQYTELGDLDYIWPPFWICPGEVNATTLFDVEYNAPYLDELVLVFEKALSDDLALAVTGFYKKRANLATDINPMGQETPVWRGIMPDGSIETKDNWQMGGVVPVNGSTGTYYEPIDYPNGWYFTNYDKAYDSYMGLQMQFSKKLSNGWMLDSSFTYSDWKRHRFEEETLDMTNFDFYNEGVVAPSSGGSGINGIFVNSRWQFKMTGLYQLPWGLNLTTFFQAREGNPQPLRYSRVFANQGPVSVYADGQKLGDERLPTFWMLNLGLEKTFKVGDTVTATLAIDWYNVTNNQITLKINPALGVDNGEIERILNPGLFQFGVRVSF